LDHADAQDHDSHENEHAEEDGYPCLLTIRAEASHEDVHSDKKSNNRETRDPCRYSSPHGVIISPFAYATQPPMPQPTIAAPIPMAGYATA
jgi:hypothetical protein